MGVSYLKESMKGKKLSQIGTIMEEILKGLSEYL